MQQIVTFSKPRFVAASIKSILAVINDVGHIPLPVLLEYRRAVYLMVVVRRRHHHTIFIGRAHLLVDALHILLRNDVGGKTTDYTKNCRDCYEYFLHRLLLLEQPVYLARRSV